MVSSIPFLPEKRIEREAESLLHEFGRGHSGRLEPPISIDDIIEKHLKLSSIC